MANTKISDLRTMLRTLVDDQAIYYDDTFEGYEDTVQFPLSYKNIVTSDIGKVDEVTIDGVATTAYTIDIDRGWIIFTVAPASGVEIIVKYRYYANFSNAELDNYLEAAIGKIYLKGYATWTVTSEEISAELNTGEKMLVCSIAGVIIDPNVDISWSTGEMRYSARQYGEGGERLIDRLINQAKLLGAKINDFYINVAGINNDTNLEGDEIEYDV